MVFLQLLGAVRLNGLSIWLLGVRPAGELEFMDATENEFVVMWERSPTSDVVSYEVRVTSADDLTQEPAVAETRDTFVTIEGKVFNDLQILQFITISLVNS